jgi:hypothetical protein
VPQEGFLELVKTRRTIRAVKSDPILDESSLSNGFMSVWLAANGLGLPAEDGRPSGKLTRCLEEMVHHDRAAEDEFMSDEAARADREAPRRQRDASRAGGQARLLSGRRREPAARTGRRGLCTSFINSQQFTCMLSKSPRMREPTKDRG